MAQGLTKFVDIKNRDQQIARVDTDAVSSVFIGGGRSNAKQLVGEEFADITGGTRINFVNKGRHRNKLPGLLSAALTSQGWSDLPGLAGVELVSLSESTFTIALNGSAGSQDFLEFSGSAAKAAIDSVLSEVIGKPGLDLKNSKSQVTVFNTDSTKDIFVGSDSGTSPEVRGLINGSKLDAKEAKALFTGVVSGRASNGTAGIEGVKLFGLTDEGFALEIEAAGNTKDTLIFSGQGAIDVITGADEAKGFPDVKDGVTGFGVFDVATETTEFVGDTNPNIIGEDFDELVGGSSIHKNQVLDIFDALVSGNGRNGNLHGLEKVELIGLNDTSFSIKTGSAGGNNDYVLFKNVDSLTGATALGFGDGPGASIF